jgi:preprotein translocase subunit SecG
MYKKLVTCVTVFVTSSFVLTMPVLAQAEGGAKPDWVLQYFVICVFLGLALAILLRPSKRSDTTFTLEERHAQQAEAMQKMKGHH